MRKIAFYTLGCKVNQADTASMEGIFRASGYEVVPFGEPADVYLVNTCVSANRVRLSTAPCVTIRCPWWLLPDAIRRLRRRRCVLSRGLM